jgi:hypothetical protein
MVLALISSEARPSHTITIPDGNYVVKFESCINNYFRSLGGGLDFVLFYVNAGKMYF